MPSSRFGFEMVPPRISVPGVPSQHPELRRVDAKCPFEPPPALYGQDSPLPGGGGPGLWSPGLFSPRRSLRDDLLVLPSPHGFGQTPPASRRAFLPDFRVCDPKVRLRESQWLDGHFPCKMQGTDGKDLDPAVWLQPTLPKCCICLESCQQLALPVECCHVFCPPCIHKAIETTFQGKQECAFCKQPFGGVLTDVFTPEDSNLLSYAEFSDRHQRFHGKTEEELVQLYLGGSYSRRLKHLNAKNMPEDILDSHYFPAGADLPTPTHFDLHKKAVLFFLRREIFAASHVDPTRCLATLHCEKPAREMLQVLKSEPILDVSGCWNPRLAAILEKTLVKTGVGVAESCETSDTNGIPDVNRLREKRLKIFLEDLISFVTHSEVKLDRWDAVQKEKLLESTAEEVDFSGCFSCLSE